MQNRILITIIYFCCSSCYSNIDRSFIDNWKSYTIPINLDTLRNYNSSSHEYAVFVKNNEVRVIKARPYHDTSIVPFKIQSDEKEQLSALKVVDGFLVGFYRGEWGGHLDWYSKDSKHHYLISEDEIVHFVKREGVNYAIQGLAHGAESEGSIISIEKENGRWISKKYLKLPFAPRAIGYDTNNEFFILTSERLLKIDSNKKITILVKNPFWFNHIYLNSISMVIKNNIIYAGMKAGVYKYNLSTGRQEWLLPY